MTAYVDTISRPVKTLTEAEQRALLKVTGQRIDGFRDHVIFSLAMGMGLREHELLAVGDVFDDAGRWPRGRVERRGDHPLSSSAPSGGASAASTAAAATNPNLTLT